MLYLKIILIFFVFFFQNLKAYKVEIIAKVNEEIITNIDLKQEINYLNFLNPKLQEIKDENKINQIAKSSIIREKIKNKELKALMNNKENNKISKEIEENFIKRKGFANKAQFKKKLNSLNLDYNFVIEKLKIEAMWNQLIFEKYRKQVKINEEYLKDRLEALIENREKKYEYYVYEILFDIEKVEELEKKYNEIINSININNFSNTANIYSISNTANFGGEIGWVKETQFSKEILNEIKSLKNKELSKPLRTPAGYLIIMYDKKKSIKEFFDKKKELDYLKKFENNRQLNQFSLIYFKRLKKNSVIYEY